jgi:Ca-activated chloride channel family protein
MLVLDTSASMAATDVAPTRIEAAVKAAKAFVNDLPPQMEVGLVAFDRNARVVSPPTVDHASVVKGLDQLSIGPGTAAGDGVYTALDAITAAQAAAGIDGQSSAAIVLLSDGVTTVGRPVLQAAEAAASAKIPISTIAFGTDQGVVQVQGRFINVPSDPDTMAAVAELTSGTFFQADSANELASVYKNIGTRIGFELEEQEITPGLLGVAFILLAGASVLGLFWAARLP